MVRRVWSDVLIFLVLKVIASYACPLECSCFGYDRSWIADCSNRNLTSVPDRYSLNTTEIFLQNNFIARIEEVDFSLLSNLQFLFLHNNVITAIHELAFRDMASSLQYLTLNENKINEISENAFANMTSLKVLNLNHNNLTIIQKNLLYDLTSGVQVSACANQIQQIESNVTDKMSSLRYAGFSDNLLNSIPNGFGEFSPNLYLIDYGNNELKELPRIPSTLRQVYLIENKVSSLKYEQLANASALYELFLEYNAIDSIEPEAFKGAPNLGWLVLTGNFLTNASRSMFQYLVNLRGLNLTKNSRLTSIDDDAFSFLKTSLTRLSFDQTNLSQINPAAINSLENNGLYVWAGNNPWKCDCKLEGFAELVGQRSKMFYDLSVMKCNSPMSKEGEGIVNVTSELSSTCATENQNSSYNETALIISLSILGGLIVLGGVIFFACKKKKNKVVVADSSSTEASYS